MNTTTFKQLTNLWKEYTDLLGGYYRGNYGKPTRFGSLVKTFGVGNWDQIRRANNMVRGKESACTERTLALAELFFLVESFCENNMTYQNEHPRLAAYDYLAGFDYSDDVADALVLINERLLSRKNIAAQVGECPKSVSPLEVHRWAYAALDKLNFEPVRKKEDVWQLTEEQSGVLHRVCVWLYYLELLELLSSTKAAMDEQKADIERLVNNLSL